MSSDNEKSSPWSVILLGIACICNTCVGVHHTCQLRDITSSMDRMKIRHSVEDMTDTADHLPER